MRIVLFIIGFSILVVIAGVLLGLTIFYWINDMEKSARQEKKRRRILEKQIEQWKESGEASLVDVLLAERNMLHASRLKEFESFLVHKGYAIIETSKHPHEILRAKKGKNSVIIYQDVSTREHLSVMNNDIKLVNEFIYRFI